MYAHYMQFEAREASMSGFIRIFHRWTSLLFTLMVAGIFVMLGLGQQPAQWIYYLPLAPLALLMITGLYMFFQPHVAKMRRGRSS